MPFWGWVLLMACLSVLLYAAIYAIIHHTHRRMPARQVAEGHPMDISAPLPMHLKEEQDQEQDLMTEREINAEREGARPARR